MRNLGRKIPNLFIVLSLVAVVASVSAYADDAVPAFRGVASATPASPSAAVTVPRPADSQPGDVLIAAVTLRLGEDAWIDRPDGWEPIRRDTCSGPQGTNLTQALFYKVASSAEPGSYRWSFSTVTGAVGQIAAYDNVTPASPVADSSGRITRNSVGLHASSVTTDAPQSLVVGAFATSTWVVIDPPRALTRRALQMTGYGAPTEAAILADGIHEAAGATGDLRTRTSTSNLCNISQLVVLRPDSGSEPPPPPPSAPLAPTNVQLPTVSGTAQVGQTLNVTSGTWTGTQPMTYGYQWHRCDSAGASCAPVNGGTAPTYALSSADVGRRIRASVRASNIAGSTTAASTPTATVTAAAAPAPTPVAPANVMLPSVTGSTQVAQRLTASVGQWQGTEPIAFAYQWLRCDSSGASCAGIGGATTPNYTIAVSDVGFRLRVSVQATNVAGNATATSAATSAVAGTATPPAPPPPPPPPPPPSPPPPPPSGGGGTTLTFTDQTWTCDRPVTQLATNGLPLRVVLNYTRNHAAQGLRLGAGCVGDGTNATDMIVEVRGDGLSYGPQDDAIRVMNELPGARDLQIEGTFNCGRNTSGFHQDGIQILGGTNITFRNMRSGSYDSGQATCQGAGGIVFYSLPSSNVDVDGGEFIGCNHGLLAGTTSPGSAVSSAKFRSGRTISTDPVCSAYNPSPPCLVENDTSVNGLTCERFNRQTMRWEAD